MAPYTAPAARKGCFSSTPHYEADAAFTERCLAQKSRSRPCARLCNLGILGISLLPTNLCEEHNQCLFHVRCCDAPMLFFTLPRSGCCNDVRRPFSAQLTYGKPFALVDFVRNLLIHHVFAHNDT